jgi:hypothetical protein
MENNQVKLAMLRLSRNAGTDSDVELVDALSDKEFSDIKTELENELAKETNYAIEEYYANQEVVDLGIPDSFGDSSTEQSEGEQEMEEMENEDEKEDVVVSLANPTEEPTAESTAEAFSTFYSYFKDEYENREQAFSEFSQLYTDTLYCFDQLIYGLEDREYAESFLTRAGKQVKKQVTKAHDAAAVAHMMSNKKTTAGRMIAGARLKTGIGKKRMMRKAKARLNAEMVGRGMAYGMKKLNDNAQSGSEYADDVYMMKAGSVPEWINKDYEKNSISYEIANQYLAEGVVMNKEQFKDNVDIISDGIIAMRAKKRLSPEATKAIAEAHSEMMANAGKTTRGIAEFMQYMKPVIFRADNYELKVGSGLSRYQS